MSGPEIDHEYTSDGVCPWCGYRDENCNELFTDPMTETTDTECGMCDKPFRISVHYDVSYSTEKIGSKEPSR